MIDILKDFYNNWILDKSADEYIQEQKYPLQEDKYFRIDSNELPQLPLFTQIKYYLVKYRRIIGVCLLLILIYYITPNIYTNTNTNRTISICNTEHTGGGYMATLKEKTGYNKLFGSVVKDEKGNIKDKGGYFTQKKADIDKFKATTSGTVLAKGRGAGKMAYRAGKDAVKYGADIYSSYSDMIFSILYQIAFVIIICIIFVPSLAFVIGGIICFTLLQRRINYLKSL